MKYYILHEGQRYGPADEVQLSQWAAEGRVGPSTMLESVEIGQQTQASAVSGVSFPVVQPAPPPVVPAAPVPGGQGMQGGSNGPGIGSFQEIQRTMVQPGQFGTPAYQNGPGGLAENTSGMKGPVPPEIENKGWSWGGFGLSWIWCFSHNLVLWGAAILVLACVPALGIPSLKCLVWGLPIYLGICGNRLAWQNRRYNSVDHFKEVEGIWSKWGLGLFIIWIVFLLALIYFSTPS